MTVSVVLPTYNRCELALRAAASVFAQHDASFELLVIDDGSCRDMSSLQSFVEREGGRYLRIQQNAGVSAARNFGAAQARGRLLAFLDSDDEWLPDKLRLQCRFMENHPDLRICQTEEKWIRRGRAVNPKHIHAKPSGEAFASSLRLCCISPSAVLMERAIFDEHGGFDEGMRVCEDYDLWLRIAVRHRVGLIERPLVRKYGGHGDQLSRAEPAMDRFRVYAIVKLLLNERLEREQLAAAAGELERKCRILAQGAQKRGRAEDAALFGQAAESAVQAADGGAGAAELFAAVFPKLRAAIEPRGICTVERAAYV